MAAKVTQMNMEFQPRPVPKPLPSTSRRSHPWRPQNAGCCDQGCPLPGWCGLRSEDHEAAGGGVFSTSSAVWPGPQGEGGVRDCLAWLGVLEGMRVSGSPAQKHPEWPHGHKRAVEGP